MNTKIVYVIVASEKSIYVEQAYMSIWSCKFHNPNASIIIYTDTDTLPLISQYPELKDLTSEIISEEFDDTISKADRSRILKTTLRNRIKGDLLYVDSDTIFCGTIDELDNITYDIAMVEDMHAPTLMDSFLRKDILSRSILLFDSIPPINIKYYNSGLLYSKDSKTSRDFYKKWHENWHLGRKRFCITIDQPALLQTTLKFKDKIYALNGIYNAQISLNDDFLEKGKILHFYGSINNGLHPYFQKEYYSIIKEKHQLTEKIKKDIVNCKSLFDYSVFKRKVDFLPESIFQICRRINKFYQYKLLKYPIYYYYKFINIQHTKILKDSKLLQLSK